VLADQEFGGNVHRLDIEGIGNMPDGVAPDRVGIRLVPDLIAVFTRYGRVSGVEGVGYALEREWDYLGVELGDQRFQQARAIGYID